MSQRNTLFHLLSFKAFLSLKKRDTHQTKSERSLPPKRSCHPAPWLQGHLHEIHAEQMAIDSPAFFSNLCKYSATFSVRELLPHYMGLQNSYFTPSADYLIQCLFLERDFLREGY